MTKRERMRELLEGLSGLLAGKPDPMDISIARATVNELRRLIGSAG